MYQGSNPSALRSREEIVKAFLLCLKDEPLESLSIKKIMDRSGLSRQTFYQIFSSKEEILDYCLDRVFSGFSRSVQDAPARDVCTIAQLFFPAFEEHWELLSLVIRNGKSCMLQRKCCQILLNGDVLWCDLPGVRSREEQVYAAMFVAGGMVSMLQRRIEEGTSGPSARDLADLICRITGAQKAGEQDGA
ncbi:MAG: TetR/AcrR family transcriptional regulator [Clostridia bacterium]|nr:TetR/AcrR family transcriptional regulator [Clostridia bacterium]